MSIRLKLLILLLAIALVPLIAISWQAQRTTDSLGAELAAMGRARMTEQLTRQLQSTIENRATILRQQKRIVELALRFQAAEVADRLAEPPPEDPVVHMTAQFDGVGRPPPGFEPSPRHRRVTADGKTEPKLISLDVQNTLLPPGVRIADVADDVARLAPMLPVFKALYEAHGDLIYWSYVSLENGVHVSFPGHGGYPQRYDPRERPWYQETRQSGERVWSAPQVDATTGELTMTVSEPVYGPDGKFAGTTAIDVEVLPILADTTAVAPFGTGAEAFLTLHCRCDDGPGHGVRLLAQHDQSARDWEAMVEMPWLHVSDPAAFANFEKAILAGGSGLVRMPHKGRDSLWAFAPLDETPTHLLMIVPFRGVTDEVGRVEAVVRGETARQMSVAGGATAALIVVVTVVAMRSSRTVTRPVRMLAAAARRLADGDFRVKADVRAGDELGDLAGTFNAMVPQLRDRMQVREALALAMEVQQNLLPAEAPRVDGFDVAGHSVYCEDTGGDYYDFIDLSELGPGRLGVAVGDVSGHGVAAALLMTTVRALLRSRAVQPGVLLPDTLGRLMEQVNRQLVPDVHRGRFMTLFYMVLEADRRMLRWVNAGHDPAVVYDPRTDRFEPLQGGGIPIGIDANWHYEEAVTTLSPGQMLIAGTDGIWESRNAAGKMFGKDVFHALVRDHAKRPAAAICDAVHAELALFREGAAARDDTTLVIVKAVD